MGGLCQSARVALRRATIEVESEKPAAVAREQRVDADRKVATQVPLDRRVAQLDVALRVVSCRRPAAFDSRNVAALARAGVLPPLRVHILAPAEQLAYQRDLLARRLVKVHRRTGCLGRDVGSKQPLGE